MIRISLRRGPYGIPVAEVEAPCEFLGEFFTAEGSNVDSWVCDDLLSVAQEIKNGSYRELHKAGDAHMVHISRSGVLIQSRYRQPPAQCELSLDDFLTATQHWKTLLRSEESKRRGDKGPAP